jgi:putative hemolysin
MKKIIVAIMLIALVFLIGCTAKKETNTQIANPASVFCEQEGGTLKIVDQENGQVGMCTLKDGTICEEWAYYRGECPAKEATTSGQEKHYCTPEQKKAEICTMEYRPVCGYFAENVKCIKAPCAITGGNPCSACATENVEYWIEGECPTNADCNECPLLSPPAPGWCEGGEVIPGEEDECGCVGPPTCIK